MELQKLKQTRAWIREELERCVDFWLKNGIDRVHGGVYTCLDRTGKIYSTDKSVWMQGRCAWMFSRLCALYGKRPEWMEAAESCLRFLEAYCINRAAGNRMYFTVTEDGKPLRQRRHFCLGDLLCDGECRVLRPHGGTRVFGARTSRRRYALGALARR